MFLRVSFFFFQAEDGIRDGHVTGVQTCALPISYSLLHAQRVGLVPVPGPVAQGRGRQHLRHLLPRCPDRAGEQLEVEIGRASCRKECGARWWPCHGKRKERWCGRGRAESAVEEE